MLARITGRRAGLGIHRTQAARRGSRLGRGHRAAASCSTTPSSIDSVTSSTAPCRSAAGRLRQPRTTLCRPGRRPTAIAPGGRSGPGAVPLRHAPGCCYGPGAAPRPTTLCWGGESAFAIAPGSEPVPVPIGPLPVRDPVGQLTVPACHRTPGLQGDGSTDCIANDSPSRGRAPGART
jgi:hypothetical protein